MPQLVPLCSWLERGVYQKKGVHAKAMKVLEFLSCLKTLKTTEANNIKLKNFFQTLNTRRHFQ